MQFPVRKHPRLPMPVYQAGHIFFLTCSTYERFPWFERFEELAHASVKLLEVLAAERGTDIFAWCLMPDHLHLLVRDDDTVEFVRRFKGRMTPIARKLKRGRSLWQKSFYDHTLRNSESVFQVAGYIWENPVRAGLTDSPEKYALSGSFIWPNWRFAYGA